jgi:hypothetical protein
MQGDSMEDHSREIGETSDQVSGPSLGLQRIGGKRASSEVENLKTLDIRPESLVFGLANVGNALACGGSLRWGSKSTSSGRAQHDECWPYRGQLCLDAMTKRDVVDHQ